MFLVYTSQLTSLLFLPLSFPTATIPLNPLKDQLYKRTFEGKPLDFFLDKKHNKYFYLLWLNSFILPRPKEVGWGQKGPYFALVSAGHTSPLIVHLNRSIMIKTQKKIFEQ